MKWRKTKRGGGKGAQWAMKQQHSGWHSQTSPKIVHEYALLPLYFQHLKSELIRVYLNNQKNQSLVHSL